MDNKKQDWYFTFGSAHAHPNGYVKIYGTFSEARKEMVERYNQKWSMQYSEKQFQGQAEEYGLNEIK